MVSREWSVKEEEIEMARPRASWSGDVYDRETIDLVASVEGWRRG